MRDAQVECSLVEARPMIEITGLAKTFRRQRVLDGIDLAIGAGDRIALVGSNGAGKTTLIRCLLGEYRHEGDVRVHGLSPRAHRARVLGRIGFVPQLPPPLRMPVGQLLGFAARTCGSDRARVEAVMARLGLEAARIRHQPFARLSGGQKQKVLIAIALGRDCELLIMDEPAANLDPQARRIFFELLAERQDRVAMLISSHRLDEVAALVNRVIELDCGRVVLDDEVADRVDLAAVLACTLTLTRAEPALAQALRQWHFRDAGGGRIWEGEVAAPDRLRFLGMLSRYVGLLAGISMHELPAVREAGLRQAGASP
jgi:ABC-2 type transport system ATP-binding protein